MAKEFCFVNKEDNDLLFEQQVDYKNEILMV